jgi:hypothetical protein
MRRRSTLVVVLALVSGFVIAGPAWGQVGPDDPLPGSTFQGGDGNQDDQGALIDWEGLQSASRVQHNPDPDDNDSSFGQGSEENNPGDWSLDVGRVPNADNILDAWSSVDQPGAATFVYLALARETASGTAFLAIELNRDHRLWNNGNDDIPCRRTGDIQVAYEFHGTDFELVLRRWRTTQSATRGCASQGCWRATDVPCSQPDTGNPGLGDNAQAAVNADAIVRGSTTRASRRAASANSR